MKKGNVGFFSRIPFYFFGPLLFVLVLNLFYPAFNLVQAQQFFLLEGDRKKLSIPFFLHRNLVVVPIYLNNKGPFNFVLDTGVGMGLITNPALCDSLQLNLSSEVRLTGAGSNPEDILAYLVPSLQVHGTGFFAPSISMTVLSKDVFDLSAYVGMPIDGILGYQFFSSFVVRFNYIESKLTLYRPDAFQYKKRHGQVIPIELIEQKPYVEAQTTLADNTQIKTRLIVDTGAGHALSLEQNELTPIPLPQNTYRTRLGTGLSGTINGYLGRTPRFQLSNFTFNQVLTSFPDFADVGAKVNNVNRNGNLGTEILRRFHFTFDYSRRQLILKPNYHYRQAFDHDMFGVEIFAFGDSYKRYLITAVEPGSPADLAGVEPQDEILFINSYDAKQLTMTKIDRLFKTNDGYFLFLTLRRKTQTIYRFAQLKRRI